MWVPLPVLLEAAIGDAAGPLATLSSQLLWFLGVYVVVVDAVRFATHDAVGVRRARRP